MRIKLLTSIAGTRFSHAPGDVVDWKDEAEAKRLIASGMAEPAPAPSGKAVMGPAEHATLTRDIVRDEIRTFEGVLREDLERRYGLREVGSEEEPIDKAEDKKSDKAPEDKKGAKGK